VEFFASAFLTSRVTWSTAGRELDRPDLSGLGSPPAPLSAPCCAKSLIAKGDAPESVADGCIA
jgi:hypothetical protein